MYRAAVVVVGRDDFGSWIMGAPGGGAARAEFFDLKEAAQVKNL